MIKIKNTKKFGRGVFSTEEIKKGTLIEVSELIIFSKKDSVYFEETKIQSYVYSYKNGTAIALGIGSLFNHADNANISWELCTKKNKIFFKTNRNIKKGEQLFINYGYDPTN